MPATLLLMYEIGWPLWVWAITKVGLPGRNGTARDVEERCVVMAVDLDDREPEGGRL